MLPARGSTSAPAARVRKNPRRVQDIEVASFQRTGPGAMRPATWEACLGVGGGVATFSVQISRALRQLSMPQAARVPYRANGLKHLPALFLPACRPAVKGTFTPRNKRKKNRHLRRNVEEMCGPRWSSECNYLRQTLVM